MIVLRFPLFLVARFFGDFVAAFRLFAMGPS